VLGQDGIIGIKTGSSPPAGACFVFAANHQVDGVRVRIVGAVMGLPTLDDAFTASKALIDAARLGLRVIRLVAKQAVVGSLDAPWGSSSDLVATEAVTLVAWQGTSLRARLEAKQVHAPVPAETRVGSLLVQLGDQREQVPLLTTDPIYSPNDRWRLTRTDPL
jgi:D-alanyl-D-alanine carboxypeptidase (penicillin-binding protein 5/6)